MLILLTGSGKQTALKSWWPQQSTWMENDHNFGHWTEVNERWYLQRLERIQDGTAQPLGVSQWRNQLRTKEARAVKAHVETLSQTFLQTFLPIPAGQ